MVSETTGAGDSIGKGSDHDLGNSDDGDGGEGSASSISLSIARRVNNRRPSRLIGQPGSTSNQQADIDEVTDAEALTTDTSGGLAGPSGSRHDDIVPRPSSELPSCGLPSVESGNEDAAKTLIPSAYVQPRGERASTAPIMNATLNSGTSGGGAAAETGVCSSSCLKPLPRAAREGLPPSTTAPGGASAGSSLLFKLGKSTIPEDPDLYVEEGDAQIHPLTLIRHVDRRRSFSSDRFRRNSLATTTAGDMSGPNRGQRRRNSLPSRQSHMVAAAETTSSSPPQLAGRRRRSESSTPWHNKSSTNVAVRSGPAPRPRTSVGGSRWSQDVRLQRHIEGRSRLSPATRTAGGRWGANHGRLEALFPGEELAPPPLAAPRENGPWIMDADHPSLGLPRNYEHLRYYQR